jgi:hypothetical protein
MANGCDGQTVSAQMMRRVLVDAARERHALKRGGGGLPEILKKSQQRSACFDLAKPLGVHLGRRESRSPRYRRARPPLSQRL